MAYSIIEVDGISIDPQTKRFPVEIHVEAHAINGIDHTGILDDTQIPPGIMRTNLHQQDAHTMTIDGRDVSSDGAKLDTIESGAEVNNLSDMQAHDLTSGLHTNWHHHDNYYYRKSDLQVSGMAQVAWGNIQGVPSSFTPSAHNHDDLYFTQTQLTNGQLDSRYYTESEIDEKIHAASVGVQGAVNTFEDLPTVDLLSGMIYIVRQTSGLNEEGFYSWNGSSWDFLVNNTGVETHNGLSGLNDGDFKHLTTQQYNELTGFSETSLHTHDNHYYTESEIDVLLNNKSNITHNHDAIYYTKGLLDGGQLDSRYYTKSNLEASGSASVHWDNITNKPTTFTPSAHNHDDLYFTQTQLTNGQLDSRYYTKAESDVALSGKSDLVHLHDDRYYTESEIDTRLQSKAELVHNHDSIYYTKINLQSSGTAQVHWNNITSKPTTFAPSAHNHDDRYYTESEIATFLSLKSDTTHNHDAAYYTKSQMQNSGESQLHWDNITNKPTLGGNNWLEPIKNKYSGSSAPSGLGEVGDRTIWYTGTGANQHIYEYNGSEWLDEHTPSQNDTVMVSDDGDSKPAQYWFNGTSWIKIADPDYANHGSLSGLNNDDHPQYLNLTRHNLISGNPHNTTISHTIASEGVEWTLAQLTSLLDGSDVSLHHHDSRYYTKTESDSKFASSMHLHDTRYYQVGTVDIGTVVSNDQNTDITSQELETLTNGSNADGLHTHANIGGGGASTLDEAYGDWGNGRTINVDYGPVQLNASDGFAPLKITPINYTPNQWLGGGEICFKNNELYYRDATRGKWLSMAMTTVTAGTASSTASGYMYTHNSIQMSSTIGFTFPFNGTIVGISMANANYYTSCNLVVRANGDDLTSKWIEGHRDSTDNLNADFDANTTISLYIKASGSQRPTKPNVILFIRRRI